MINATPFTGNSYDEAINYLRSIGITLYMDKNTVHCPQIFNNTQPLPYPVYRAIDIIFKAGMKENIRNEWKRKYESPIKSALCQFKHDEVIVKIWEALDKKDDTTGSRAGNILRYVGNNLAKGLEVVLGEDLVTQKGWKEGGLFDKINKINEMGAGLILNELGVPIAPNGQPVPVGPEFPFQDPQPLLQNSGQSKAGFNNPYVLGGVALLALGAIFYGLNNEEE